MAIKYNILPKPKFETFFEFIDVCSGIGGMRLAFENLGGNCVFSSEWDKFCQKTYKANFGEIPLGDITKINLQKIPKHQILLAGFPCQPFSKGGYASRRLLKKDVGFKDNSQGKIFYHIYKIIKEKKPKIIFLENVPHLIKLEQGKFFKKILLSLENLGYSVNYKIINSDTVVPQRRSRLYIVAVKGKEKFEFPSIPELNPMLKNILERKTHSKYILSDNLWEWLQKHAKKHEKKGNGFKFRLANKNGTTCTLSARYGKDGSEILIPRRTGNPRKLTPRECARLMGFPDSFKIPVSDTQAYKQFGNSVVVSMIYLLGYSVLRQFEPKFKQKYVEPIVHNPY